MHTVSLDRAVAWRAVRHHDTRFDGQFVYAVRSTRVFCRPSCPSRRPTRSRVEFFASPADAERAGYRACKRCRPSDTGPTTVARAVTRAVDYLDGHPEERVTLATLSRAAGMSAFHLQRAFKRALGVSPREYHEARRRRAFTERLREGNTVSRATYEAGYGSSSRVYERSARNLGMTPGAIGKRAKGERVHFSIVDSSLGRLLAAYTERGVCCVKIGDDERALEREFRSEFSAAEIIAAGPAIHEWIRAIVRAVETAGPVSPAAEIPLDARGTAFQWRVWKELQRIPRGTTLSYTDVARRIGRPKAVRAVAGACASNPVAVVVPCHRVRRSDGSLGGYRWGIERKQQLLERESGG